MNAQLYIGDLNLGGIPEWKWNGVWSQAAIDRRWAEIGAPLPVPILPPSLEGTRKLARSNGVTDAKTGKPRPPTRAENDFINYFIRVASDPYRKQSGVSKVAGGILKVAGAAIPAFSYFEAAAAAGNIASARGKEGANERLATRVMEPAYTQAAARTQAKEDAAFTSQMKLLQSLAPTAVPLTFDTATPAPLITESATVKKSLAPPLPWMIAGSLLLLGVALS